MKNYLLVQYQIINGAWERTVIGGGDKRRMTEYMRAMNEVYGTVDHYFDCEEDK